MARLNADTINKIAKEISQREDFDMVFITKIKVWFVRNERNVWEVSDEKAVRARVNEAIKAKFQEVIAEQHAVADVNEMSNAAMARVQEVLDLYKSTPLSRITTAMKRYANNDGEILTQVVETVEEDNSEIEVIEHSEPNQ